MSTAKDIEGFLGGEGRKLLFYHQDGDGVCSAALAMKAFPSLEPHVREGPQIDGQFIKWLSAQDPKVLFFLDLPVDQEWKKILALKEKLKGLKIIVIDHHVIEKDLNKKGIVHYNPRFDQSDIYQPTAYLVYRLFRDKQDIKKSIWVAAMGTISDHAFEDTKDVLDECGKQYPGMLEGLQDSRIGEAAKLVSAAITLHGTKGAKLVLKALADSKDFYAFAADPKLNDMRNIVNVEIDRVMRDFEKHKEEDRMLGTVSCEIESRMNIISLIASILARRYPRLIIILRKRSRKGWKVSARWQEARYNLGEAIKHAASGIGLGGGHEKAAGAQVSDWKLFWSRLKKEIAEKPAH